MKVQCPTCKKLLEYNEKNEFRPFCSERCKLLDLGAWAMEKHAIPTEESSPDEIKSKAPPKKDDED